MLKQKMQNETAGVNEFFFFKTKKIKKSNIKKENKLNGVNKKFKIRILKKECANSVFRAATQRSFCRE